jgi:hypothetical protein
MCRPFAITRTRWRPGPQSALMRLAFPPWHVQVEQAAALGGGERDQAAGNAGAAAYSFTVSIWPVALTW